ncbi:Phage protein [Lactococcus lactis subsp. lactis]|uniref:hypothetical protein n=1 Tax=Lactococcus lactis TaxID=1358 RepID=UPI00071DBDD5|nr:hypothetical protein [Lactococcus lactis]KST91695.1 Phage protein [Lactococcus lactis subsp. lactis]KST92879.1 Phage protein [Lactococcus lactis subsp. lactis]MCT1181586.1 hypothetical protein [Lactococcus lactis]
MKDNKQVPLIQRTLLEVAQFKKYKLNEFLIGESQWWYSKSQDIIMAMKNGDQPNILTKDWLWVMSTIDGNLVLDGKGGIGIEVE